MASRLNPYLSFEGNARAAMRFYKTVFGGELTMNTFGEFGMKEAAVRQKIMHAVLETDAGYTIMASDIMPGMEHLAGNNITVSLSGDDDAELRGYWKKLSRSGEVTDAAREADLGRRVRPVQGQVRHRLDGEHRPAG